MKTLGTLEVYIGQQLARWKGGGSGARQLQRGFGFLVARRGHQVRRDDVINIAGGRNGAGARHVIYGIRGMLKLWGIEAALTLQQLTITLQRHPHWRTDTDQLELLVDQAQALSAAGRHAAALTLLEEAEPLCGGDYLPILDLTPEYGLEGERAHWKVLQKKALQLQVRACLVLPHPKRHDQALRVAGKAIAFDRDDPLSYELAAKAAHRCGHEEYAHKFQQVADDLRKHGYSGP